MNFLLWMALLCCCEPCVNIRHDLTKNDLIEKRLCRNLPSANIDLFRDGVCLDVSSVRFALGGDFVLEREWKMVNGVLVIYVEDSICTVMVPILSPDCEIVDGPMKTVFVDAMDLAWYVEADCGMKKHSLEWYIKDVPEDDIKAFEGIRKMTQIQSDSDENISVSAEGDRGCADESSSE